MILQDVFHNAEEVLQEFQLSLNLLDKAEKFVMFFFVCLLVLFFITVIKKMHLYFKASSFQFGCSGTPRHKYEIYFAIYNIYNQSCIAMCKMKGNCC